jgi:prophage antirepressor-like protein
MQYAMQVFEDHEHDRFTVIDRNGDPWFILNEVCAKLGIANPSDAAGRLDDDEKSALGIADPHGRLQRTTIINESGLYSVILRSRVPKAKAFKKWVTSEVLPSIRKTGGYHGKTPAFIRRYSENWDRVSAGHFSVLGEMVVHLWGRFEMAGHVMADNAPDGTQNRPDVSAGRLFSDWLKENHPTVSTGFSYYMHWTPEWEGEVRQYPRSLLHLFLDFLDTEWIPNHAPRYFKTRDAAALPYLPKILPSPDKPKAGMMRKPFIKRKAS